MIVARPLNDNESDLLIGHEHSVLTLTNLEGALVYEQEAPCLGWRHEQLESIDFYAYSPHGWDAYLDKRWIGSSEV